MEKTVQISQTKKIKMNEKKFKTRVEKKHSKNEEEKSGFKKEEVQMNGNMRSMVPNIPES